MSFTKFCGSLKQSLIENSKWFQKTSILEENISWWVTCTENDVSDTFMNSKDQMKKKKKQRRNDNSFLGKTKMCKDWLSYL